MSEIKALDRASFISQFGWKAIMKRKEQLIDQRNKDAEYYGKWQYAPITTENAIHECYEDYLEIVRQGANK